MEGRGTASAAATAIIDNDDDAAVHSHIRTILDAILAVPTPEDVDEQGAATTAASDAGAGVTRPQTKDSDDARSIRDLIAPRDPAAGPPAWSTALDAEAKAAVETLADVAMVLAGRKGDAKAKAKATGKAGGGATPGGGYRSTTPNVDAALLNDALPAVMRLLAVCGCGLGSVKRRALMTRAVQCLVALSCWDAGALPRLGTRAELGAASIIVQIARLLATHGQGSPELLFHTVLLVNNLGRGPATALMLCRTGIVRLLTRVVLDGAVHPDVKQAAVQAAFNVASAVSRVENMYTVSPGGKTLQRRAARRRQQAAVAALRASDGDGDAAAESTPAEEGAAGDDDGAVGTDDSEDSFGVVDDDDDDGLELNFPETLLKLCRFAHPNRTLEAAVRNEGVCGIHLLAGKPDAVPREKLVALGREDDVGGGGAGGRPGDGGLVGALLRCATARPENEDGTIDRNVRESRNLARVTLEMLGLARGSGGNGEGGARVVVHGADASAPHAAPATPPSPKTQRQRDAEWVAGAMGGNGGGGGKKKKGGGKKKGRKKKGKRR